MIPVSPQKKLKTLNPDLLVLESHPSRRVFSIIVFIILLLSLVFGIQPEIDLSGKRLIGTIVFILLLLTSLLVSLYTWKLTFDRKNVHITEQSMFVTFTVKKRSIPIDAVKGVLLTKVVLIRGNQKREATERSSSFMGKLGTVRQRELVNLQLLILEDSTDMESPYTLDSSTDSQILEDTGKKIADFCNVSFRKEEQV